MGVTSSSRFRQDAEFLLRQTNLNRLEHLMAKHAKRILDVKNNYNILVRLCEEGHFDALVCAIELSRKALSHPNTTALRDMRMRLKKAFGPVSPETVACHLLTFVAVPRMNRIFGSTIVPRVDHAMPFLVAAERGHWEVVKWMCTEAGVSVLAQDPRTGFGLLHACCKGGQAELLHQLLSWDLQVPTDRGYSPLHSSWHRSPDDGSFVPWVDMLAKGGVTPLMVAAFFGRANCVQLLLQRGASLRHLLQGGAAIPLPSGSSALHCAARGGSSAVALSVLKGLYTSAGGILPGDAGSNDMRAPWEGNEQYDMRVRANNIGLMPFKYASLMDGVTTNLERMLHPALPLALVIRQSDPEWRGHEGGVPRLYALALSALRESLLSQLDSIEHGNSKTVDPQRAHQYGNSKTVDTQHAQHTPISPAATTPPVSAPGSAVLALPNTTTTTTTNSPLPDRTTMIPSEPHMRTASRDIAAFEVQSKDVPPGALSMKPDSFTVTYNHTFEPDLWRLSPDTIQYQHAACSYTPGLVTCCLSSYHSLAFSEASESGSECESDSFAQLYSTPCLDPDSSPEAMPHTTAMHTLKALQREALVRPHAPCSTSTPSRSFELPCVVATAGSPAAIHGLGANAACSALKPVHTPPQPSSCLGALPAAEPGLKAPSVNDALSQNISHTQQIAGSPFVLQPVPAPVVVPPPAAHSMHSSTGAACSSSARGEENGQRGCSLSPLGLVSTASHIDSIRLQPPASAPWSQHTERPACSSPSPYAALLHESRAAAGSKLDAAATSMMGTMRPAGTSHTPDISGVCEERPCMPRRHSHHAGSSGLYLSFPECNPVAESTEEHEAEGNVSLLGRLLAAVDIGSCMSAEASHSAGPVPQEPRCMQHRSRRSLPGSDALAGLSESVSRPAGPSHGGRFFSAPGGAGDVPSSSTHVWDDGIDPHAVTLGGMVDASNTAGYSSEFLPAHRRSRGSSFASFRKRSGFANFNLRRSLKSMGGLSCGMTSMCDEAGDEAAMSDGGDSVAVCPICMDADLAVSVQACSHCFCVDCARRLCTAAVKPVDCPLCRVTVDRFVKAGCV